ncbi:MAG: metallophosphoesterase family protein, partial [Candidatus Hodarchaeales archaeon]
DNINLFTKPSSFVFEKDGINIKIIGFPYIRRNARKKFNTIIKRAFHNSVGKNPNKGDYSILVTHQLIEGSRIENYTFREGNNVITFFQIPRKFDYIACGHIHRFQFLYNQKQSSFRSTNKFHKVEQNNLDQRWQFNDKNGFPRTSFRNPIIAYAGSLDRVSIAERNEPKGYIIGELQLSGTKHGIRAAKYQFHELSAIEMVYYVWDLSKASIEDYVYQTIEKLYGVPSIRSSSRNNKEKGLSAILRIKIKGKGFYASKKIEYLKQEANRLNVYLTFSYSSISA